MSDAENILKGYRKLKSDRIHLRCPQCGYKMSNAPRADHDPPSAVLFVVCCPRCSLGCKIDGGEYYDAEGKEISQEPTDAR